MEAVVSIISTCSRALHVIASNLQEMIASKVH